MKKQGAHSIGQSHQQSRGKVQTSVTPQNIRPQESFPNFEASLMHTVSGAPVAFQKKMSHRLIDHQQQLDNQEYLQQQLLPHMMQPQSKQANSSMSLYNQTFEQAHTTSKKSSKNKIFVKGNQNRSITPILQTQRIDLMNPSFGVGAYTPLNYQQLHQNSATPTSMGQNELGQQMFPHSFKHVGPSLNINEIDGESQYCLEHLISPNFQPQSTISMQKRIIKQQANCQSHSSTRFQGMSSQSKINFSQNPANTYSSLFRKKSTCSNNLESPSVMGGADSSSNSMRKIQIKQQSNPKRIMNDSLNMISKTRNKLINKSFQQHSNSSNGNRVNSTKGDNSESKVHLGGSGNQILSVKKFKIQPETQKKLPGPSFDMHAFGADSEHLDQSYGRIGPENFVGTSTKASRNQGRNWTNKTEQLGSSQHSQYTIAFSNQKISSERENSLQSNKNGQNGNLSIIGQSNMSTTHKKNQFKVNFKQSHQNALNTPLCRSQLISHENLETSGALADESSINSIGNLTGKNNSKGEYGNAAKSNFSQRVSPMSSLPKKQLNFTSKQQQQLEMQNANQGSMSDPSNFFNLQHTEQSKQSYGRNNYKGKMPSCNQQYSTQNTVTTQKSFSGSGGDQSLQSNQLMGSYFTSSQVQIPSNKENSSPQIQKRQLQQFVRPFEFPQNYLPGDDLQHQTSNSHGQYKAGFHPLDHNDQMEPTLFYTQQNVPSTTSQHSNNDAHFIQGKKNFKVPKISQVQQMHQPQMYHNTQEQRRYLDQSSSASSFIIHTEATGDSFHSIKRSQTPNNAYYQSSYQNCNDPQQYIAQQNLSHTFQAPQSSGEDISFNVDCSQNFQMNQSNIERPVTVGEIPSLSQLRGLTQEDLKVRGTQPIRGVTIGQQSKAQYHRSIAAQINTIGSHHNTSSNQSSIPLLTTHKLDESVSCSENLETSRFSATLDNQIQQNQNILTNTTEHSIQAFERQQKRFLKVAPNASQIKKAVLSQANQRKVGQGKGLIQKQQYLNKMKSDVKGSEGLQQSQQAQHYLRQLKQEMEERKDQQMQRNQELLQLDRSTDSEIQGINQGLITSAMIGQQNSTKNTNMTGNNIFFLNSQQKVKKSAHKKHSQMSKYSSIQKRDRSADNVCNHRQISSSNESNSSSNGNHQESSSSFEDSPSGKECCRNCLASKPQSRCSCGSSERSRRCSLMSKLKDYCECQKNSNSKQQKRKTRKVKRIKNKDGRLQFTYKDNQSNQVFQIDAPNNVFFNDETDIYQPQRGRQIHQIDLNGREKLIPMVKRNLTPDDHIGAKDAESYLLVDSQGQPRKVYIQRNIQAKTIGSSPIKVQARTLDYEGSDNQRGIRNNFSTLQQRPPIEISSQRKKFLMGGESSLICCLSTKSHRENKYDSTSQKSASSRCNLQ